MRKLSAWRFLRQVALVAAGLAFIGSSALATVPQVTAFSPTSGTIGDKIVITGSGFTGTIAMSSSMARPLRLLPSISATKITATAPTAISTGLLSITTAGGTGKSIGIFTATPGLQLSTASGHPQIALTVSGAGFHKFTPVDVYFDTTDNALAVPNGNGLVSMPFQVPASAQPGTHWITLIERGTNLAVQQPFTVNTDWKLSGFTAQNRGFNTYENTVDASNVGQIVESWITPVYGLGNFVPFVVVNGQVYSNDIDGGVHAYKSDGSSLWTATIAAPFPANAPVAYNGFVYFGDGAGNVLAFKMNCRSDGGVCAPTWTKKIGGNVTSGLTLYQGLIYAPSDDNSFHVLDPATGTEGTPIFAQDQTHGTITTPVSFAADGTFYYAAGKYFSYRRPGNSGGYFSQSQNTITAIAVYSRTAFLQRLFTRSLHVWRNQLAGDSAGWRVQCPRYCKQYRLRRRLQRYRRLQCRGRQSGLDHQQRFSAGADDRKQCGVRMRKRRNGRLFGDKRRQAMVWRFLRRAAKIVNGVLYSSADELSAFALPDSLSDKRGANRPSAQALHPNYALRKQPYAVPTALAGVD